MIRTALICSLIGLVIFIGLDGYSLAAYISFFQPSLQVSQEFTDNIFLTENNQESDWITVISPTFLYEIQGKTSDLSFSYAPGYSFYKDHDEYNSMRHTLSLDGSKKLAEHLSLSLSEKFFRTEKPYTRGDLSLTREEQEDLYELDYTIRQNREPYYNNHLRARLDYQFGKEDTLSLSYRYSIRRDDNPEAEDSDRHSPSLDLTYRISPHLGLQTGASYTRGEFSEDTDTFDNYQVDIKLTRNFSKFLDGFVKYSHTYLDYKDDDDDYQIYNPGLGINYRFARDAFLTLGIGYYIQDEEDNENEKGFNIDLDLGKSWRFKRGAFRLTGASGYDQTYFGAENLGFTQYYEARGNLTYALTRYLSSNLSLNYRYNRYTDQEPERKDHVATLTGGLNYQWLRWLNLGLSDSYRVVESNHNQEDYRENRIILNISMTPSPMKVW